MKSLTPATDGSDLRQRKEIFDNSWMLVTVLAAVTSIFSWYFRLTQIEIGPVTWTLAALAAVQFYLNSIGTQEDAARQLRTRAMFSQSLGILGLGVAWHLDGGLQHPTLVLLLLIPLFTGALILDFWQQQMALALLFVVLFTGIILSADTNSFIEEHYGLGIIASNWRPQWLPRSRIAFLDMTTTPTYNIVMVGTVGLLAVSLSAVSRHIVALANRFAKVGLTLQAEVDGAQALITQLITNAPGAEVLVTANSGRILHVSDRFKDLFDAHASAEGRFLLDTVRFAYPDVIRRLIMNGGDEIQGATIGEREAVLRVRARLMTAGTSPTVRLSIETCDEICWRGSVDSLLQPVFAVNSRGEVVFLNRSAIDVFGQEAEGAAATSLFEMGPNLARWWDIAPLESARRVLDLRGRRYLASIRRERIAESIGELSFVHLHEREQVDVAAAS